MLSSDPKLPQLSQQEAARGAVPVSFYRRFQERFYTLWRELARNDEKLRERVDGGKFDAVYVGDGTAALPSVTNQGDENTGVFFPAANQVAITTDGTERVRVDASGNVGIGTSSPGVKLDVLGSTGIRAIAAATQDAVIVAGRAGGTGSFAVTLTPTTLSASRTLTLPDNSGTVLTTGATVAVSNGGTGQTTYTDGQLLIGNTTGNTLTKATLTGTANQITVTNGSGSITLSTPQSINTTASVQFGSFGVGTAASGTTGEIRATNNVTAYYSSDRRLKENIQDIPNALRVVDAIGGKLFDWTDDFIKSRGGEDGYFVRKADFGVIAQDVLEVFSRAVREREDGTLAVNYEKLCALAFAAIRELKTEVEKLKEVK